MPLPFPCSPVIRECSQNKTQIEKKKKEEKSKQKQVPCNSSLIVFVFFSKILILFRSALIFSSNSFI